MFCSLANTWVDATTLHTCETPQLHCFFFSPSLLNSVLTVLSPKS
jgi:hypothetical protein